MLIKSTLSQVNRLLTYVVLFWVCRFTNGLPFQTPFKRSVVYQSHILNLFRLGNPEKWLKRDTNQFFSLLLLPLLKCFSILFELELYWICCMYNNKKKRREGKKNSIRKWSRKQDGVIIDIQPNFKVFFE